MSIRAAPIVSKPNKKTYDIAWNSEWRRMKFKLKHDNNAHALLFGRETWIIREYEKKRWEAMEM